MSKRPKRAYKRNHESRHQVRPVWKQNFDEQEFARILLLLAMHLDETKQLPHNKGQQTGNGGGHHD